MRLQLTSILYALLFLSAQLLYGQADTSSHKDPIDVNFLFNYYEQDGNHSAVTGGEGTQELSDIDGKIVIHVPLDTMNELTANIGVNHYSSASTDRIDFRISSASRVDTRAQAYLTYRKKKPSSQHGWSITGGGSIESDYISSSLGLGWDITSRNEMRNLELKGQCFMDTWVVIYPEELRRPGFAEVPTNKRRSYNLSVTGSQILTKRMQVSVNTGVVYQSGLLSTPFHRIYFENDSLAIEQLPTSRVKFPLGFRFHYFAGSNVVIRSYYRFYTDSWGIRSHTFSLETPIHIGNTFTLAPFYRYYTQEGTAYFNTKGTHDPMDSYFTSDYDLSTLWSYKAGAGLSIAPVNGIVKVRTGFLNRGTSLKKVDVAGAFYRRSDGLKAWYISLNVGFQMD